MAGNGAETVSSLGILENISGCRITRNAAIDYTSTSGKCASVWPEQEAECTFDLQQGRAAQSVSTVNTTSHLTCSEKARNDFAARVKNVRLIVDLETTHGVMQDGLHVRDVEEVVHLELATRVELRGRKRLN